MSREYTKYDWASDRLARQRWADDEERLVERIDRNRERRKKHRK